jgi:aspartate racemase
MHRIADDVEAVIGVPLIHIADVTADAVKTYKISTVALLGTRFTMEEDFYVGRLRNRHGLNVMVPNEEDRDTVHKVIYEELVRGVINPDSKKAFLDIVSKLASQGAQGVIAGCTEIELLVPADDVKIPYFPTAQKHAEEAARFSLGINR